MAQPFDAGNAPFNRLSPEEVRDRPRCARHRLFPPGRNHHRPRRRPESLFIVIKGCVEERDRRRGRGPARSRRRVRQPGAGAGRRLQRLRRARGDALQSAAPRSHAAAHQPQSALRLVLLSRHLAQARRHVARGGGSALRSADESRASAISSCTRASSSMRRIRFNAPARDEGDQLLRAVRRDGERDRHR